LRIAASPGPDQHGCGRIPIGSAIGWSNLSRESAMTRKYVDCRESPSVSNCTVAISADTDDELLEAVVQHAVAVHGHQDTPELRRQISAGFKQGTPALDVT